MALMHKHHIIPKHEGGTDDPSNLVLISVEQHAEAHRVLWEKNGKLEDYLAWMGLSGQVGKEEILIEIYRQNGRRLGSLRKGKTPWNAGGGCYDNDYLSKLRSRVMSDEAKAKLRGPRQFNPNVGVYERTDEIKNKTRKSVTGYVHSNDAKAKMSTKLVGNERQAQRWSITFKDGSQIEVINLAKWARSQGINVSSLKTAMRFNRCFNSILSCNRLN